VDKHVGGAQELWHAPREPHDADSGLFAVAGLELLVRMLVVARERDDLIAAAGERGVDAYGERPHTPAAARDDDERPVLGQAESPPRAADVTGLVKPRGDERPHGEGAAPAGASLDPRDGDLVHHDVQVGTPIAPHRVVAEISDRRAEDRVELASAAHPTEGGGQRRMSADDDVGVVTADEPAQTPPSGPVQETAAQPSQRREVVACQIEQVVAPGRPAKLGVVAITDQVSRQAPQAVQSVLTTNLDAGMDPEPILQCAGSRNVPLADVG
jgi:hypothetical protein